MKAHPLPLIACATVCGMCLSWQCEIPRWAWLTSIGAAWLAAFALRRLENLCAIALLSSCVALAGLVHQQRLLAPPAPGHVARLVGEEEVSLVLRVVERLPQDDGVLLVARAKARYLGGRLVDARGGLRLFVSRRTVADASVFRPGTRWVARLRLFVPPPVDNPGQRDSWQRRRMADELVSAKLLGPPARVRGDSWAVVANVRERLELKLTLLSERPRSFWAAVLLGRRGGIEAHERERFVRTGTAHLLAISGLHLGLIAGWLFLLLRVLLSLPRRLAERVPPIRSAAWLTLPALWGYALLSGMQPSTLRAALMASLYLGAVAIGRRPNGPQSLAFAVVASLFSEPLLVSSIAFQLSVTAVAALLYTGRGNERLEALRTRLRERYPRVGGALAAIAASLWASLAASLATLPLAWHHFYILTPAAPIDNLVAIPLVSVALMPLGMLWLVLALAPGGLEQMLVPLLRIGAETLYTLVAFLDRLPLSLSTRAPSIWASATLALSVAAALGLLRRPAGRRRRLRLVLLAGLLLTIALHNAPTLWHRWRPRLTMHALSVGQGDCIVLQLPDGRTMVIDGAGSQRQASDPGRRVILPALRYLGIERVDVLVLSHRDWDHLGGLFAIVEALPVGELWFNGRDTRSPGLLRFLRLVRRKGIPIKVPLPGARRFGGLRLEVLQPREDAVRRGPNSYSLTLRLVFGRISFLFPGDIERDAEERLLESGLPLRSTVIKVPHHGSSTSSHRRFLERVAPRVAVFCVGRHNRFHFPRPRVWARYGRLGVRRLRTDRDGAIRLSTDGETLELDWFLRKRMVRYRARWYASADRSHDGH